MQSVVGSFSLPVSASVFFIFYDSCQVTNYLKNYHTDLCQIFSVGITMAVDDQSGISFSVPQGTLAMNFC